MQHLLNILLFVFHFLYSTSLYLLQNVVSAKCHWCRMSSLQNVVDAECYESLMSRWKSMIMMRWWWVRENRLMTTMRRWWVSDESVMSRNSMIMKRDDESVMIQWWIGDKSVMSWWKSMMSRWWVGENRWSVNG